MKPDKSKIEKAIALALMKAGVSGPEIDDCIEWAFGKGAWYVPISPDWIDRWNKLHPLAFRLKRTDNFVQALMVIGHFYMQQKKSRIILPN